MKAARVVSAVRFVAIVAAPVAILVLWSAFGPLVERKVRSTVASLRSTPPSFAPVSEWPDMPLIQSTRVLTPDVGITGTVDIAVSGNWLLALQFGNRLVGVNLATETVYDLTPSLAGHDPYNGIWRGRKGEFLLGGANTEGLTRLFLDFENGQLEVETSALRRPRNFLYSLPLRNGYWLSNAVFPESGLLSVEELVDGHLVSRSMVGRSLFPDVSARIVLVNLNANVIAAAPGGDRIAQVFRRTSRIHVYSASGTLERRIAGPIEVVARYDEFPALDTGETKMRTRPDTKFCYIDVAATSTSIVALFSGRSLGEFPRSGGEQLHVFQWDGRLIGAYKLDAPVQEIAAGPDERFVWAFRPEASEAPAAFVEYPLPTARAAALAGRDEAWQ